MKKKYFTIALLIIPMSMFSQTKYYVNDNNIAGDVFTTAVGNDANPGTAAAPLASIITAYLMTLPGDTIFVDAGTYTADGTIGKSLTILGTNYLISPNNAADPLLPNPGRNAESIITNTTWTIGANNVNLEGLTFDPNSRTAVRSVNVSNIRLSKNRFKINASNTHVSFTGVGNFTILTSEIINSGFTVTDNRFEKFDPSNGVTLNINRVKNVNIANNSFVTPGATLRTQLILSAGTGGVTDAIVFSNNTVDKAATTVGNGASGNMVITGNKIYNTVYALRIDYSMSESSKIDFSNNLLDGGSGISPLIQFIKRGGFAAGAASSFKAENNTITGNAIPSVTSFMGSFYVAFTNTVLNPSLILRRNKISYTGDYSTMNGQDISPFVLAGNINNANVDNNEVTFSGTNIQPRNPVNNLPLCPAISLYPENGSGGVVQPGAVINILNNKVDGFKQSFVVFDPFDIANGGMDNYSGYGNLNPLALLKVNYNSFTNDSMSVNNGDNPDNDLDVHCNWYGSTADQDIITKISYQSITAIPWLTNGIDNDPATGFQPVPGSCDGYPPMIVLNGYTNVTCPGGNNGTININTTFGKAPFIYTWTKVGDPGFISHDEDPINLSPGTYHLAVVDGNGSTIYVDSNVDITSIDVTIVTIADTQAPVITCPAAITVNCDGNKLPAATGTATATDNCTVAANIVITYTDISTQGTNPANNAYYNYAITRTWKATDVSGNFNTCDQAITVHDVTAPAITCPANLVLNCQDNNNSSSTGVATGTDNCSPVTITQSQTSTQTATGAGQYNYVITRNWRATDVSGNYNECVQTILVHDITAPVAKCKPVTVTLVNGTATITASSVDNGSSDNCSPVIRSVSRTNFNCSDIGPKTVTLTVSDVTGNSSTCTTVVTVVGEVPTCSITAVPSNNTYSGGVPTNIYIGYGPQSVTLNVATPASGAPYTYSWSGGTLSNYNTTNPVFTATTAGLYTFSVLVTNRYGCTTTCVISICVTDIRVPGTGGNGLKVYLCHLPPGNPGNSQTLSISVNAVPAHLGNHVGDRLGKCELLPCTAAAFMNMEYVEQSIVPEVKGLTVKAMPNPSSNYFLVSIESNDKTVVTVRVMNSLGQFIDMQQHIAPGSIIQIGDNYKGGTYFLQAMQGNILKMIKLVKLN